MSCHCHSSQILLKAKTKVPATAATWPRIMLFFRYVPPRLISFIFIVMPHVDVVAATPVPVRTARMWKIPAMLPLAYNTAPTAIIFAAIYHYFYRFILPSKYRDIDVSYYFITFHRIHSVDACLCLAWHACFQRWCSFDELVYLIFSLHKASLSNRSIEIDSKVTSACTLFLSLFSLMYFAVISLLAYIFCSSGLMIH